MCEQLTEIRQDGVCFGYEKTSVENYIAKQKKRLDDFAKIIACNYKSIRTTKRIMWLLLAAAHDYKAAVIYKKNNGFFDFLGKEEIYYERKCRCAERCRAKAEEYK